MSKKTFNMGLNLNFVEVSSSPKRQHKFTDSPDIRTFRGTFAKRLVSFRFPYKNAKSLISSNCFISFCTWRFVVLINNVSIRKQFCSICPEVSHWWIILMSEKHTYFKRGLIVKPASNFNRMLALAHWSGDHELCACALCFEFSLVDYTVCVCGRAKHYETISGVFQDDSAPIPRTWSLTSWCDDQICKSYAVAFRSQHN